MWISSQNFKNRYKGLLTPNKRPRPSNQLKSKQAYRLLQDNEVPILVNEAKGIFSHIKQGPDYLFPKSKKQTLNPIQLSYLKNLLKRSSRKKNKRSSRKVMAYKAASLEDLEKIENLRNYFSSEKIDGWQVHFDSSGLKSKTGKIIFHPPMYLPPTKTKLAGELHIKGKQSFDVAGLRNQFSTDWKKAKMHVFDLPSSLPFAKRRKKAENEVNRLCKRMKQTKKKCFFQVLKQTPVKSTKHAKTMLAKVLKRGGEGLVLTKKNSKYEFSGKKRTTDRVKIKPRNDMEGRIVGYNFNKKKQVSSIKIERVGRHNYQTFNLSSGLTKSQKSNPNHELPLGAIVKFSYRGLTKARKPKETRFIHFRLDAL